MGKNWLHTRSRKWLHQHGASVTVSKWLHTVARGGDEEEEYEEEEHEEE